MNHRPLSSALRPAKCQLKTSATGRSQPASRTGRMGMGTPCHCTCASRLMAEVCSTLLSIVGMPRWQMCCTQRKDRPGKRLRKGIRSSIRFRWRRHSNEKRRSSRRRHWPGLRRKASWLAPSQSLTLRSDIVEVTKVMTKRGTSLMESFPWPVRNALAKT